jgi:branched-subunit amino acid transport protein
MLENLITKQYLMPWILLFTAALGIFVWRFLGVVLSSKIKKDSNFSKWINAVAYAMTTGLMLRIIFFPTGALASTELFDRLLAFIIGIVAFLCFPKKPILGLIIGIITFAALIFYKLYF